MVGIKVGFLVIVGAAVDGITGTPVGAFVGGTTGAFIGSVVGLIGVLVGQTGSFVGLIGAFVGLIGAFVGLLVGTSVGAIVGALAHLVYLTSILLQYRSPIWHTIRCSVRRKVTMFVVPAILVVR